MSGSDSDFEIALRETVHLSDARVRIDHLSFTDSFFTTDAGRYLYFASGSGFVSVSIPEACYTGFTMASAIQAATNRDTVYNVMTNSISHTLASASQRWLSDEELAARTGAFPAGASSTDFRSLNTVLGKGVNEGSTVTWPFVRMSPWPVVYLRSSRLRCEHHHGPRGTHDILYAACRSLEVSGRNLTPALRSACTTISQAARVVAQLIFSSRTGWVELSIYVRGRCLFS